MNQDVNERTYSENEVAGRLAAELPQWSLDGGAIRRRFRTNGWKSSLMVVNAIGHLAEAAWHHPDISVSYGSVTVDLSTHSAGGITDKDFELARKIEQFVDWRPAQEGGALEGTPADPRYQYIKHDVT